MSEYFYVMREDGRFLSISVLGFAQWVPISSADSWLYPAAKQLAERHGCTLYRDAAPQSKGTP